VHFTSALDRKQGLSPVLSVSRDNSAREVSTVRRMSSAPLPARRNTRHLKLPSLNPSLLICVRSALSARGLRERSSVNACQRVNASAFRLLRKKKIWETRDYRSRLLAVAVARTEHAEASPSDRSRFVLSRLRSAKAKRLPPALRP